LRKECRTFYDEGIHKLLTAYQDDISPLLARLRAMVDVSKTYSNYSGISDGMDGSVKFIYRTDSIEKTRTDSGFRKKISFFTDAV
jgi:putative membrane protein